MGGSADGEGKEGYVGVGFKKKIKRGSITGEQDQGFDQSKEEELAGRKGRFISHTPSISGRFPRELCPTDRRIGLHAYFGPQVFTYKWQFFFVFSGNMQE